MTVPVFRRISSSGRILDKGITGQTVGRIVKARAQQAGLNPSKVSAHSLRSGFFTEAGHAGVGLLEAMAISGHKTLSVPARYYRAGAALDNKAARLLG